MTDYQSYSIRQHIRDMERRLDFTKRFSEAELTTKRRTESEDVRKEQILAAARKVFRERGYDRTTISDIVREAGVAQGTFYLYYPSKRDAFIALSRQFQQMMADAVMGAATPEMSLEERNKAMTRAGFEFAGRHKDLVRLLNFGADSISEEVQYDYFKGNPLLNAFVEEFEGLVKAGVKQWMDAEITAHLIYGMYEHAMVEAFVLSDGSDAKRWEEGISQLVINALRQ